MPRIQLATSRSHSFAGQLAGLLHPSGQLSSSSWSSSWMWRQRVSWLLDSPGEQPYGLIQLELEDCDMVAEKMVAEEAEAVIPIKDRPYGKREGRIRDPFGHLWILSQQVAG